MISQQAIAIAESQALRFTDNGNDNSYPSFNKSWINVYLSPLDQSGNTYKLRNEKIFWEKEIFYNFFLYKWFL